MFITLINKIYTVTLFLFVTLIPVTSSFAQVLIDKGGRPVADYLPADVSFNPSIPTPESILGANVGEWHVRHDQLVKYMQRLAEASPRVSIKHIGTSHENKPLLLLTITSPTNQDNIETLRTNHLDAIRTGTDVPDTSPLFLYMGYGVHGNEPSASNSALVVAYYLAAAQGEKVEQLLNSAVVLLDPVLNPDGMDRFALWANMHKGQQLVADANHREHKEGWPSGRTNHYWFDLNRDWLLLTHPESQARVAEFHRWRPHIATDYHEMGTNSTYFFQPGVRTRKNPFTPDENVTLTTAMATHHATALDKQKQLYFTEEAFDDFYVGKGSTFPDVHGSIGILFEQASARGHLQESINGPLAFEDAIANQVTTSLSTFDGAMANKAAILDYQTAFVKSTRALAKSDDEAGYLLPQPVDEGRFNAFLSLLSQHHIEYRVVNQSFSLKGKPYKANSAVFVPLAQAQYRLIKSLFSQQTSFEDNTFYDVSSWHIGYAFNLHYDTVYQRELKSVKTAVNANLSTTAVTQALSTSAYAYVFSWSEYFAPALLQSLLESGVSMRIAKAPFTANLLNGQTHEFEAGSVIVVNNDSQVDNVAEQVANAAQRLSIPVYSLQSGLTPQGIDLGSRQIVPVSEPKVLVVGGEGTREYEVGEIWHHFDTRVGLPVTLVDQHRLDAVALEKYSHIIFASGRYRLPKHVKEAIGSWVEAGGVLVGQKSSLALFAQQNWLDIDIVESDVIDRAFDESKLSYADQNALAAKKRVSGAVYETSVDLTHPLFFGFPSSSVPFFKTSNMIIKNNYSPFTTPAVYTPAPLLSGYSDSAMVSLIADTPAVVTTALGSGVVIGIVDDTVFRGYWYGTNKLLSNAVYLSDFIH